jgi:glucose/arabinose dehydrogenase
MPVHLRRAATAAALALTIPAAVAGCQATGTDAVPVDPANPAVQTIATGLQIPWGMAFLPDGTALVTERRTGRILSLTGDGHVTEVHRLRVAPTADGSIGIHAHGEAGLLGIAISPHYATDKWVYIYYTGASHTSADNRIARLHLGGAVQPILTGIPAGDNHAGGRIAFGPDGMLYATTGETYLTPIIAQDPTSLGGKILRVTPDGKPAPGNPFPNSPVWSIGHRNVQGLAWDAQGRLYASEFGDKHTDEINLIPASPTRSPPGVPPARHHPAGSPSSTTASTSRA